MFGRFWGILTLICILACAQSLGQTSQPSQNVPTAWQEAISNLAKTLTEGSDDSAAVTALGEIIPNDASILKFASTDPESRYSLRQLSGGLSVVSARAYCWPMETFVSDLTADLRNCDAMPDALRRSFMPKDDVEAKRANTTAQQWVNAMLHPAAGEFVAVIFLWDNSQPSTPADEKPPVFVLVKGKKIDTDQIRITQLVFGDAKQALN